MLLAHRVPSCCARVTRHLKRCSNIAPLRHLHSMDNLVPFHLYEKSVEEVTDLYHSLRHEIYTKDFQANDVSRDVFVNNEVSLRHVTSFGFDYDYTLAIYSEELHSTIYAIAMDNLINMLGYPEEIRDYKYDNSFPIRGLHFDTANGYLMKIDSHSRVQMGTVYKGMHIVFPQLLRGLGSPQKWASWGEDNKFVGLNLQETKKLDVKCN